MNKIKKIGVLGLLFIHLFYFNVFASITNPYVIVNNNIPYFNEQEKQRIDAFENYSQLDNLGRCGVAYANICKDILPKKGQTRGKIDSVTPTGWKYNKKSNNKKYSIIKGGYIYNRCHLIAYSLAGENDNKLNLITGTRSLNIQGMWTFEEDVLDYVKKTGNHVLYRVTPEFENDELVARSVLMEGWSVEDNGDGICYCIRAWNNEDGITINYATGENWIATEEQKPSQITDNNANIESSIETIPQAKPKSSKTSKSTKEPITTQSAGMGIFILIILWYFMSKK